MELLLIFVVAGGLIWLLGSGSKSTGGKKPVRQPPVQPANDDRQHPITKD